MEIVPEAIRCPSASSPAETSGRDSNCVSQLNLSDSDEEEDVCRICRNSGDAGNPLKYPCACRGSIKFVHHDCLLQWLNHSNARRCEVCKHPFSFSPVYADNAPARLPFQEFLLGIALKAGHVLQFFIHLNLVLSVWLLIIPVITFWVWRLAFVRSFSEAHRLILSHLSTKILLTDCLHGFLLWACIVFISLGATSLRDYLRHFRELEGQVFDRENEGDRNGAHAARRHAAQANQNFVVEGNGEDAGRAQGDGGDVQIVRLNGENVAARLEMQAARIEAHVEQMFDQLDDVDGGENVPFDEPVVMQGPRVHLVEIAFKVLARNMIFLAVVIFLPFSSGSVAILYLSWVLSAAANPVLSTVVTLSKSALSVANISLRNVLTSVVGLIFDANHNSFIGQVADIVIVNSTEQTEMISKISSTNATDLLKEQYFWASRLSDVTTLAIGYIIITSLVIFYLGIVTLIRYIRGDNFSMRRLYSVASIADTIPSLCRKFMAAVRHLRTVIKLAMLLVVGLFCPMIFGWWLDVCTIEMFGKSISERVEFFSLSPLASSLVHGGVGIVFMLQKISFESLLREVLRTGVLHFLPDPADPNYNPLADLIDDSICKYARSLLVDIVADGSLIVLLVFLPAKLAMWMVPSFPLNISISDPFTEIPADMLLFQLCIPFAVKQFKVRHNLKYFLRQWFTVTGLALGLTDFLLPKPEDTGENENEIGNADHDRRHRLHAQAGGQILVVAPDNVNRLHRVLNTNSEEEYDCNDPAGQDRCAFVLRIVLLLMVAWLTLLIFNTLLIVLPISLGRTIFNALPLLPVTHGIKCNDIYAFGIGSYVIWAALVAARYSIENIRTGRTRVLLGQISKWCGIILKSFVLLSIWIFIIPALIGLLFDLLVIVPIRVPVDESPVFLLYQDWALGFIFLKIWTRLVMLDPRRPLIINSWHAKFERVREHGFSRLQGLWVLREIVVPIIMKLLTALCFPYVLARGIFPIFGYSLIVNSAVYRFAWLGCLFFSLLIFCAKRFHVWFTNLHNSIRDDRYLIGRSLHNYGEDAERTSDCNSASEI